MKRRDFIATLGGAAIIPLAAHAQQAGRVRRLGVLITGVTTNAASLAQAAAFYEGLEKLGWADGRNIKIESRWGDNADRLAAHAAELAGMKLDVVLAGNASALTRVKQAIRDVPIVFANVPDPVENGFVTSVSRPDGNITGFANYEQTIGAKWLELLKQLAPSLTRVAYNYDAANPATAGYLRAIEAVAPSMGVVVSAARVQTFEEIERNIGAFAREPNGGLIVPPGPLMTARRSSIVGFGERHRLPAVFAFREDVQSGGLSSYGVHSPDLFRRAASYVDRILKGEKPGNLPIQFATKFHLAINLKTAKALGLDIPVGLLARTDEVVE